MSDRTHDFNILFRTRDFRSGTHGIQKLTFHNVHILQPLEIKRQHKDMEENAFVDGNQGNDIFANKYKAFY